MRTLLFFITLLVFIANNALAQKKVIKAPSDEPRMETLKDPDMSPIYGKGTGIHGTKASPRDTMNIIPPSSYSRFSVGANYGISFYTGQVNADAVYPGYGGYLKYSFSHVMGLRAQYLHGKFSGGPTMGNNLYNAWFNSTINTASLQFIFNMGTVDFRKSFPRDNFYFGIGGSLQFLKGERENPDSNEKVLEVNENFFAIPLTFGYKRKVSKNIDIGVEASYMLGTNGKIDLYEDNTTRPDGNGYMVVGITYNITSKKKPMHIDWYNPIDKIYRDLEKSKQELEALKLDDDKDGVPNIYDQEPNTKEGYKVDSKGVTLDSDFDGIPDSIDSDPYGFEESMGKFFPGGGFGSDSNETIYRINDSIPQTDFVTISRSGLGLPTLTFPPNHYTVHVEQYNVLQQIARILILDTTTSLVIIGHADNNKPNLTQFTLAERRALEVKRRLYKIYEIDEERMLVFSEKDPYVQRYQMASEGLDRKVEFRIIRPVVKKQPRIDKEDMRLKEGEIRKDPDVDRGY